MRRFPITPPWLRIPESMSDARKVALIRSRVNDILKWLEEVEHLPTLKDHAPEALTAANDGTVNSGDATTDDVIEANRTRIGEIEALLQGYGLLPE